MSSLDEIGSQVAVAVASSAETGEATVAASDAASEVAGRFSAMSAEGLSQQVAAIRDKLQEASAHLAAFDEICRQVEDMTQAAKAGLLRGSDTQSGVFATTEVSSPQVTVPVPQRPREVPGTWLHRGADNGKGDVWQRPGSVGNANMVRVMQASNRYPHGYIRFYNGQGQPIGADGRPGPRAHTHIPIAADGTYETPQGWNHV